MEQALVCGGPCFEVQEGEAGISEEEMDIRSLPGRCWRRGVLGGLPGGCTLHLKFGVALNPSLAPRKGSSVSYCGEGRFQL